MFSRHRALVAYAVTATLVRSADSGAVVGFVLLATSSPSGPGVAGLLVAALTAPHLAAPLLAPLLDRTSRPRVILAAAFVLYALSVGAAALLFSSGQVGLSAIALVLAGACGPLHTGGLSSRLGELVSPEREHQRRAQGLDALTYGLAAAAGPAVVTLIAALADPLIGVLTVGVLAAAGSATLAAMPAMTRADSSGVRAEARRPILRQLAVLFSSGPLRRVTVCTSLTAVAAGAVPILAVASSAVHGLGGPGVAAMLASAFGAGTLVGSLIVTARPLRGSPERAVTGAALGVSAGLVLCAVAPTLALSLAAYAFAGILSAVQFASSLAARAEYSPPDARAQVFMTMAGLKVAFSSSGVALAGLVAAGAPMALLG
ncbi:MAG TPA: MFS transporter, partial [Microbacterium sp.]|nr:MFS transporter [Microbacterium sp.]